jgi:hypothetical protein
MQSLKVAYNSSDYQQALFLTPEGNRMVDFGLYFRKASVHFTGVRMGELLYRALLTTEMYDTLSSPSQRKVHLAYARIW